MSDRPSLRQVFIHRPFEDRPVPVAALPELLNLPRGSTSFSSSTPIKAAADAAAGRTQYPDVHSTEFQEVAGTSVRERPASNSNTDDASCKNDYDDDDDDSTRRFNNSDDNAHYLAITIKPESKESYKESAEFAENLNNQSLSDNLRKNTGRPIVIISSCVLFICINFDEKSGVGPTSNLPHFLSQPLINCKCGPNP